MATFISKTKVYFRINAGFLQLLLVLPEFPNILLPFKIMASSPKHNCIGTFKHMNQNEYRVFMLPQGLVDGLIITGAPNQPLPLYASIHFAGQAPGAVIFMKPLSCSTFCGLKRHQQNIQQHQKTENTNWHQRKTNQDGVLAGEYKVRYLAINPASR